MKRRATTTFLCGVMLLLGFGFSYAEELTFGEDYAAAHKKARKESRGMVVEFETAWCPFCRAMEKVTFKDPRVVEAASDLVLVKVDADNQKALARRFRVGDAFPLFVFLDASQEEVFRLEGYHPPDSFLLALQSVAREDAPLRRALQKVRATPEAATARLELGDRLYEVGAVSEAVASYEKALEVGLEGAGRRRAASRSAEHCRTMGRWAEAEAYYRELLESDPDGERAPFWRLALVQTYLGWGREDEARAEGETLAAEHPGHPAAERVAALLE